VTALLTVGALFFTGRIPRRAPGSEGPDDEDAEGAEDDEDDEDDKDDENTDPTGGGADGEAAVRPSSR